MSGRDDARDAWLRGLPALARDLADRWQLILDGEVRSGEAGAVLPARRADGTAAAVKLQRPGPETDAAIVGLTRWDGNGTVRLFASDAGRGAMLLEYLHADRSLHALADDDAIRIVGGLLQRLHSVPAPAGLGRLENVVAGMVADAPSAMPVLSPQDQVRFTRWMGSVADVSVEPGAQLLHWDLHYGNVLAADREPWLAIDPEPLIGDPGFDLWPALDSGLSAVAAPADAARLVRRRFDTLTEMLALDRQRAAAWTRARLMQNTLWDIEDGNAAISTATTVIDDALARY